MTFGLERIACRKALRYDAPVLKNVNPFADAHHQFHVVFDEQDRQVEGVAYLANEAHQFRLLLRVHSGGRLI